jgi:hypothetical protein
MTRVSAVVGSALFLVIAPGVLAGLVPWWMTRWQMQEPFFGFWPWRVAGALLILAGIPVLLESFTRFALQGGGTPAPVAPTRLLVVEGTYPGRWWRSFSARGCCSQGRASSSTARSYGRDFTSSSCSTRSRRCATALGRSTKPIAPACRDGCRAGVPCGEARCKFKEPLGQAQAIKVALSGLFGRRGVQLCACDWHRGQVKEGQAPTKAAIGTLAPTHRARERIREEHAYFCVGAVEKRSTQ